MGKLKLAVLGETVYMDRLADSIQKNGPEYLEVASCKEAGRIKEFLDCMQPDILLYEESMLLEKSLEPDFVYEADFQHTQNLWYAQWAEIFAERCNDTVKIVLTDTKGQGIDGCQVIFRYQSGELILRQIFQIYEEVSGKNVVYWYKTKDLDLTAVYAPGGHELQLPFSVSYASLCGENKKVLLLNLSEFSGMNQLFGDKEGANFSDLVFGIRQNKEKFQLFFQQVLHHMQGFDYVQPPGNPQDLYELQEEDLEILLSLLKEQSEYQMIIFHCGMLNEWSRHVMDQCSKVYCVVKESMFGKYRKEEFEQFLEKESMDSLKKKVKYVSPQLGSGGLVQGVSILSQLQSGEFAVQVRGLVQDE